MWAPNHPFSASWLQGLPQDTASPFKALREKSVKMATCPTLAYELIASA